MSIGRYSNRIRTHKSKQLNSFNIHSFNIHRQCQAKVASIKWFAKDCLSAKSKLGSQCHRKKKKKKRMCCVTLSGSAPRMLQKSG